MTVTEQAQAAQVEKLVRELIGRPKALVGMDLHSRKVTLTVSDWVYGADPIVKRRFLDVSLDALESTYTRNVSKDSLTIIEASTNSFAVVKRLKAIGYKAVVVYSAILKGFSRDDRINDRIDSEKLTVAYARFGSQRANVFVPTDEYAGYRDIVYGYRNALKDMTRTSNRIWAFCGAHGMPLPKRKRDRKVSDVRSKADAMKISGLARFQLDDLLDEYDHALKRHDKYRAKIVSIVSTNKEMIGVMQSPGIGVITAFALVAFVEDVRRFETAKKLVSYIGANPRVNDSGEDKGPQVLTSYGNKILKGYFVQVGQAVCRRRTNHGVARWARAKIASGKAYNKVCMAVANKSITYAWHILMGHPAPNRDNEALYRKKIRDLGYELGEKTLKGMGFDSNAAFVKHIVTPLYAHLSKPELQTAAK